MRDRFLKACRLEETDCRPIWLMRQAGRYLAEYREIRAKHDVFTICKTPELAAEITAIPVEKFDLDAAVVFADIMLPLEALGVSVEIKDEVGPIITNPIRTSEQVQALRSFEDSEVSFVYEAIREARKRLNNAVPIIGFSGAPFTLASYMIEGRPSRDFAVTKLLMHNNPAAWRELMGKLSDMVISYLSRQVDAGADVLQLFDSWVGCLSPSDYEEYVLPFSKRIIDEVSKRETLLIHFGTDTASLLPLMRKAGGDVMSVDWRVNIDEAWRVIGFETAIQGNLDPTVLLSNEELIQRYAGKILERTEHRSGHIFSLGHGVLPQTPPQNVKTLVNFVHNYVAA
jgi:uroporphyrinogen decarboxylase